MHVRALAATSVPHSSVSHQNCNAFRMQTCMSCILEVCNLLVETPEAYAAIEPALLPLVPSVLQYVCTCWAVAECFFQIFRSLDSNNFESHEDGIQVLKYILHYSPVISPAAWGMFSVLVQACVQNQVQSSRWPRVFMHLPQKLVARHGLSDGHDGLLRELHRSWYNRIPAGS